MVEYWITLKSAYFIDLQVKNIKNIREIMQTFRQKFLLINFSVLLNIGWTHLKSLGKVVYEVSKQVTVENSVALIKKEVNQKKHILHTNMPSSSILFVLMLCRACVVPREHVPQSFELDLK